MLEKIIIRHSSTSGVVCTYVPQKCSGFLQFAKIHGNKKNPYVWSSSEELEAVLLVQVPAPELLVILVVGVVPVHGGCHFGDELPGRTELDAVARAQERRHGQALPVGVHHRAVPHAAVLPVAKRLQLVPDVDDKRTGLWVDGDPLAAVEHLQASDLLVHAQDGERVGVGVRGQPIGELRGRALRVKVDGHVLLLLTQRLPDVAGVQTQVLRDRLVEPEPERPDLLQYVFIVSLNERDASN
jgi:hypothetical protein